MRPTFPEYLMRSHLLLGDKALERLTRARVIIFGVGGVGSWCAESLVRSGVTELTIVDSDRVCVTNINRQLMATTSTVGRLKVEVLSERLLDINPQAHVTAVPEVFCAETAASFDLASYDVIVDAIDSLQHKMLLIEMACRTKAIFVASMGAALKLDPTRIQVAEFNKVKGCPLARALRQRFKREGRRPSRRFLCVFSDELLPNHIDDGPEAPAAGEGSFRKAQANGTAAHITAIFGFVLAGLVVQRITTLAAS